MNCGELQQLNCLTSMMCCHAETRTCHWQSNALHDTQHLLLQQNLALNTIFHIRLNEKKLSEAQV